MGITMNCTKGTIEVSNFGKPGPITGLYIAGATFLCIIQMVRDLVNGFKTKQIWIPTNNFSVNAALITIIGIAVKLSTDLITPMPSQTDQLAKLATSAFICTVLANILPSLGKLEKGELQTNTIALAILIITSVVDLCIQLNTGAIHAFRKAHIVLIYIMCVFLELCLYIAASLPVLKTRLQRRFERLHQDALDDSFSPSDKRKKKSLEKYLMRFSMMAQSSCPHFVLIRSASNVSVSVYGLISASTLFFVLFATVNHNGKMVGLNACSGESDYRWSVLLILIIQVIAVVIGLIFPFSRIFYFLRSTTLRSTSQSRDHESSSHRKQKFWNQQLNRTKDDPVFPDIKDRVQSPNFYKMKEASRAFSSIFQLVAAFAFMGFPTWFSWMFTLFSSNNSDQNSDDDEYGVREYFLHVEGEERFIDWMVLSSRRVTQKYLTAETWRPENLYDFLKHHLISDDFEGVYSFQSDRFHPSRGSGDEVPPKCWSLPVLTLACIAAALPGIDRESKEKLRKSVTEGLVYVKLVEDNLNDAQELVDIRAAASNLWSALDRGCSWILIDLQDLARNNETPEQVLSSLAKSADEYFSKTISNQQDDNGPTFLESVFMGVSKIIFKSSQSPEASGTKKMLSEFLMYGKRNTWVAVAAHSMYGICQTLLPDCKKEGRLNPSSDEIFDKLRSRIADILGACFTNLRKSILLDCERSTIEKRRETAFCMLKVFSEIEGILEILEVRKVPDLPDGEMPFIDEWRRHRNEQRAEEEPRTQNHDGTEEQSRHTE